MSPENTLRGVYLIDHSTSGQCNRDCQTILHQSLVWILCQQDWSWNVCQLQALGGGRTPTLLSHLASHQTKARCSDTCHAKSQPLSRLALEGTNDWCFPKLQQDRTPWWWMSRWLLSCPLKSQTEFWWHTSGTHLLSLTNCQLMTKISVSCQTYSVCRTQTSCDLENLLQHQSDSGDVSDSYSAR